MHALLLLALGAMAPVDSPKDEEVKKEMVKLQGVWKATAIESRGEQMPASRFGAERFMFVVVGNDYVFTTHAGTLKIDPSKRPKTIDCTITDGRYKGQMSLGIYELEGNTLKFSLPSPVQSGQRPPDLKSDANTRHAIYTLERDAKATKEAAAAQLKQLKAALTSAAPVTSSPRSSSSNLQQTLDKILERLDRIDKRLEALEKKKMTR